MQQQDKYETLNKYDRAYGDMRDVGVSSKPVTVQYVDGVGRAETFIVETIRDEKGDHLFLQCVDEKQQVTRLAVPPRVVKAIQSQIRKLERHSEKVAKERRSEIARARAVERMERGEKPAFLVPKKKEEGTA